MQQSVTHDTVKTQDPRPEDLSLSVLAVFGLDPSLAAVASVSKAAILELEAARQSRRQEGDRAFAGVTRP